MCELRRGTCGPLLNLISGVPGPTFPGTESQILEVLVPLSHYATLLKLINRLLISVFVLVDCIVFIRFKWVKVSRKPLNLDILKCVFLFCILLRPLLVMHTQNFNVIMT